MSPRKAAPFTSQQRAQVLRALARGESVYKATQQAGVKHSRFYTLRRADPHFEAAVIAAVKRGARTGRAAAPILEAAPRIDEDLVCRLVLQALGQGASLRAAAAAAGTTPTTVLRIRRARPDQAVVDTPRGEGHRGPPPRRVSLKRACAVPGCPAAKTKGRGLCARHYYQWYLTGPADQTYERRPVCQTPRLRATTPCPRLLRELLRPHHPPRPPQTRPDPLSQKRRPAGRVLGEAALTQAHLADRSLACGPAGLRCEQFRRVSPTGWGPRAAFRGGIPRSAAGMPC